MGQKRTVKERLLTLYYAACAFLMCWQWIIPAQLADPDLWGRLSVAALWFENGYFPYRDVFSFTAFHHRWIDHEWLSGVLFYLPLWLGGEIGLHVLKYGLILTMFYLLFSHCRRTLLTGATHWPMLLFAALALLFPLYGDAFLPTIRAQIFSFLFFIAFLWILERVRQAAGDETTLAPANHRLLWWLIPLGVIWANTHGGFILGLILLALYGLGAWLGTGRFKSATPYWTVTTGLVIAIGLFNPYGFAYWPFIVHALTMPRPFIGEWDPLPLLTMDYWPLKLLMAGMLSTLVFSLWRTKNRPKDDPAEPRQSALSTGPITALLVMLFLTALAVKGMRFKAFFTLGALFYLPMILQWLFPSAKQGDGENRPVSWLVSLPGIAAGCALALILTTYPAHFYARTIVQTGDYATARGLVPFPVEMMEFLKNSPYRGNLINPFSWGEFLAWTLYPRFKVAWDGRYEEVYQKPEMDFYTEFYALPHNFNPQRITEMANHSAGDFILIERISPNQSLVAQNSHWRLLASDGFYFLYGRESTLKRLPPYHPASALHPPKNAGSTAPAQPIYTIGDFLQLDDLQRFRSP
jgi:hypothetical protein